MFPYRLTPYTLNKAYYSFHRLPDNKARFPPFEMTVFGHCSTSAPNISRKMCKYENDPFEYVQLPSANVREFNLTIDELKAIRDLNAPKYNIMVARDIFMLSYYLEGMNLVDILQVDFRKPYIEYYRTKTKNKKQEAVSKLK